MKVRVKKLVEHAVIPQYAHATDAGMDLVAVSVMRDSNNNVVYGTGLAIEIPRGYVGLIFPRSSNAKQDVVLTNCVGVIDSGYRGEITMKYGRYRWSNPQSEYKVGDRVGQLIILPYPDIIFEETDELSESERGANGYGSTGR